MYSPCLGGESKKIAEMKGKKSRGGKLSGKRGKMCGDRRKGEEVRSEERKEGKKRKEQRR